MKKRETRIPSNPSVRQPARPRLGRDRPADVNPAQWKAISHKGKHLLIVAGPGTGKTHTLTYRIAQIVEKLAPDKKILAITFTNKTAQEMRERLNQRLGRRDERIEVGTFHSFSLQLIRQFINQTSLPEEFEVASPETITDLAKAIWPQKSLKGRRIILEQISQWKSALPAGDMPEEVSFYNQKLRDRRLLDFDDLLWETLQLLQNNPKVLAAIHKTYAAIFVDEYQDINAIQHALLKIWVGNEGSLTAIGDPNQAIYGFRGSDVSFFTRFVSDFPGAVTLSLSENYRSAPNLLSACGQVMARSKSAHVPELVAKIYTKGLLTIYQAPSDKAEAEYVVHEVEKMVGGTSMFSQDSGRVTGQQDSQQTFGDIAVLYRLNNERLALREAFERSGIPYHIAGPASENCIDELCPFRGEDVSYEAEKVCLMTLHAAKGLEFPVVFIVGCEKNLLPLDLENMTADQEEERRLLYVGMTRARKRLYLLSAKRRRLYGRVYENEPSPFLADIEEELKAYEKIIPALSRRKRRKKDQMTLF